MATHSPLPGPTALLVCGPPCAGKSTVARRLRNSLGWPLLAKDAFKESLFDVLGWSDRAWSKRISRASYAVMFAAARELSIAGQSYILEGNFRWTENEAHFAALIEVRRIRFVQVFCSAPTDVLIRRWRLRTERGKRHPGHLDRDVAAEIEAQLRSAPPQPLPLGEPALMFDSSRKDAAHLDELVAAVMRRTQT